MDRWDYAVEGREDDAAKNPSNKKLQEYGKERKAAMDRVAVARAAFYK
jgi:hypothetical protein